MNRLTKSNRAWSILCFLAVSIVLGALLFLSGCQAADDSQQSLVGSDASAAAPQPDPVEEAIKDMTIEQKVAQLFFIKPESLTDVGTVVQAGQTTQSALEKYPVGGLIYFKENLVNSQQTADMLSHTHQFAQDASGFPIFIGVDEEGGLVTRVGGNEGFDIPNVGGMWNVGATGDDEKAESIAETIGGYLTKLGFNVDFAPCCDIAPNSQDTLNKRSFGTDPNLVKKMVVAQIDGFEDAGILCCAKHFPGLGDSHGDSHEEPVSVNKSMSDMEAKELVPFKGAIEAGVPMIMVGHLSTPAITGNDIPASLSSYWMKDVLRDQLHFDGIVITDALNMRAATAVYGADRIGVEAFKAGADMILMPDDFTACYNCMLDAVKSGEISQDRIDESLKRILKTKFAFLIE